jgi:hypothetical protein
MAASCSTGGQTPTSFLPSARGTNTVAATGEPVAGVKWDWDGVSRYGPYLERFGGGNTFYEAVWCDIEATKGSPDWTRVDDVVDSAASFGFRMFLKIRVGSCWATERRFESRGTKDKTASALPTDLDAYRRFVASLVARYAPRGVHRYAVENEVNLPGFWQSSAADFEALVRTAAPVIRATDPEAVVLDSGISSTGAGSGMAALLLAQGAGDEAVATYQRYYQRRFLARKSQLPDVADATGLAKALRDGPARRNVDFLDATFRLAGDHVTDAYQLHFYERWDNVPELLDYLRGRLPAGFPIESWETGIFWPGGNETDIAAETAKTTSLLLAGGVRPVIWLPAAADPTKGGVRWGLFDGAGRPRLAADVFLHLAQAASASDAQLLSGDSLDGAAFTHDGRTYVMRWSDDGTRLTRRPPEGTTARRLDGTPLPWEAAGLRLDHTPIVVELAGPAETAMELVR